MKALCRELAGSLKSTGRGKHIGGYSYYHMSLIQADRSSCMLFNQLVRELNFEPEINVLKISVSLERLSFLRYEEFDQAAFPCLLMAHTLGADGSLKTRDYSGRNNPPILHRKELLLLSDNPLVRKAEALTTQLESLGMFSEPKVIGTLQGWESKLTSLGYSLRGNTVLKSKT